MPGQSTIDFRVGQRVLIVHDGVLYDTGRVEQFRAGDSDTAPEVRVKSDFLHGETIVFRYCPMENVWRWFRQDPFADPGCLCTTRNASSIFKIEGWN